MNGIRLFQVDSFATEVFHGNPAAVCPLANWPSDKLLQAIAQENNLSETAFFVKTMKGFELRWFAPRCEVGLCGHATLAAAFVIFNELAWQEDSICFETHSGPLIVSKSGDLLSMDLPTIVMRACPEPPPALLDGLGIVPVEIFRSDSDRNYVAIYETEIQIRAIKPDLNQLEKLHPYGVAVSSPGNNADCTSRYFAPGYGIPEDSATGSIHCALAPYWSQKLNKRKIQERALGL
jgi:PhzF family phenazine biosynthesis protein